MNIYGMVIIIPYVVRYLVIVWPGVCGIKSWDVSRLANCTEF
jgi:hypothetical protein